MTDVKETIESLFDKMLEQDSDQMDFHITRDPEPGKTFSKEALSSLNTTLGAFVGARIARRFRDSGDVNLPGVSSLTVTLSLELDGETRTVSADLRPWYLIDGSARAAASAAAAKPID